MAAKNVQELEELEELISRLQDFLKRWVQFERMLRDAHHKLNLTGEAEKQFLQMKSQCARLHEYLMERLGPEYLEAEHITSIVRRTVTPRQISNTSDQNYFGIQHEWSLRYLHLQETLAKYQYRRDQLTQG